MGTVHVAQHADICSMETASISTCSLLAVPCEQYPCTAWGLTLCFCILLERYLSNGLLVLGTVHVVSEVSPDEASTSTQVTPSMTWHVNLPLLM